MKYINKFDTEVEYKASIKARSEDVPCSYVCSIDEDKSVRYIPQKFPPIIFNATEENRICSLSLGGVKTLWVDGEPVLDNTEHIGTYEFTTSTIETDANGNFMLPQDVYPFKYCISYSLTSDIPLLGTDTVRIVEPWYGSALVPAAIATVEEMCNNGLAVLKDEYTLDVTNYLPYAREYGSVLCFYIERDYETLLTIKNKVFGPAVTRETVQTEINKSDYEFNFEDPAELPFTCTKPLQLTSSTNYFDISYKDNSSLDLDNNLMLVVLYVNGEPQNMEGNTLGGFADTGAIILRDEKTFRIDFTSLGTIPSDITMTAEILILKQNAADFDLSLVNELLVVSERITSSYKESYTFETLGLHEVSYDMLFPDAAQPNFSGSCLHKVGGRMLEHMDDISSFYGSDLSDLYMTKHAFSDLPEEQEGCLIDIVGNLEHLKIEEGHKLYDTRNNCNGLIRTSDNVLIKATKYMTKIPDSVTDVALYAFDEDYKGREITLSDNLTRFPQFSQCPNIKKVHYKGDKITTIDYRGIFRSCPSVKECTIPDSVTLIEGNIASYCDNFEKLVIGPNVTNITKHPIVDCPNFKTLVIDPNNPVIDARDNCNAIVSKKNNWIVFGFPTTTVPNSVTQIYQNAFSEVKGMNSFNIPDTVTSVGQRCFQLSDLKSITIGNGITSIPYQCFYFCKQLTEINWGENVQSIGESAFYNCISLTSITIPDSVTSVGKYAFQNCSGATELTIGSGLSSFTDTSFLFDYGLANIHVSPDNTKYTDAGCNVLMERTGGIVVLGCKGSTFSSNSMRTIGTKAFNECSGLTTVHLPNSVSKIESSAFYNCNDLYDLYLGNVSYIGANAFYSCGALRNVIIPDTVTTLGNLCFESCNVLSAVTIGSKVSTIGNRIFDRCYKLNTIYCKRATDPTTNGKIIDSSGLPSNVTVYYPEGADYSNWKAKKPNWTFIPVEV